MPYRKFIDGIEVPEIPEYCDDPFGDGCKNEAEGILSNGCKVCRECYEDMFPDDHWPVHKDRVGSTINAIGCISSLIWLVMFIVALVGSIIERCSHG